MGRFNTPYYFFWLLKSNISFSVNEQLTKKQIPGDRSHFSFMKNCLFFELTMTTPKMKLNKESLLGKLLGALSMIYETWNKFIESRKDSLCHWPSTESYGSNYCSKYWSHQSHELWSFIIEVFDASSKVTKCDILWEIYFKVSGPKFSNVWF